MDVFPPPETRYISIHDRIATPTQEDPCFPHSAAADDYGRSSAHLTALEHEVPDDPIVELAARDNQSQISMHTSFRPTIDWAAIRSPRLEARNSWMRGRVDLSPPPPYTNYRGESVVVLPRWWRELEIILEIEGSLSFEHQHRSLTVNTKARVISQLRAWLATHDPCSTSLVRPDRRAGWFNASRVPASGRFQDPRYLRRGRFNRYFDERRRHRTPIPGRQEHD